MSRRNKATVLAIIIILVLVALGFYLWRHFDQTKNGTVPATKTVAQPAAKEPVIPDFSHIVIILEENHGLTNIIGNSEAPFINKLAKTSALATNYDAIFHPSLPNYLALTSGTNGGITTDCSPSSQCWANVRNITDEIEASGRTWKAYEESMPAACTTVNSGLYAVRHDPFVYYPDISQNPSRCDNHVVPFSELAHDLANNSLPNYVFITPNVCNDMHDCSVQTGDNWLKKLVPKILQSKAFTKENSLLAITWDEAEGQTEPNRVPLILAGQKVKKNFSSSQPYNHYSLLKTIETAWQLKPLTDNNTSAKPMLDFFNQ